MRPLGTCLSQPDRPGNQHNDGEAPTPSPAATRARLGGSRDARQFGQRRDRAAIRACYAACALPAQAPP
jgi:hypothetical protein